MTVGPRAFLPSLVLLLAAVVVLVVLGPELLVAFGLGAVAGAAGACALVWRIVPDPVRPWIVDAIRTRAGISR